MSALPFADINEQFAKFEQLRPEDVVALEEWQRKQPHLPPPLHPIETLLFLHSCYYSNEKAKRRIEAIYTLRTHCPEFFTKCDPLGPEVQQTMDVCLCTVLPQLTPEGYLVFYNRLLICNANMFNFNAVAKFIFMMGDLHLRQRGCHHGHVAIMDLEGVTLAHLLKSNILSVKKYLVYLQVASPIRLNGIHFINGSSILDKLKKLVQPFIKKKFYNRIYFHSGDNSTMLKYLPKDILPIECGGSNYSATEYYKNVTRKTIESNSEFFLLSEGQVADESRRLGEPMNAGELFGVEGTFKKLDID